MYLLMTIIFVPTTVDGVAVGVEITNTWTTAIQLCVEVIIAVAEGNGNSRTERTEESHRRYCFFLLSISFY